jgi:hypothetical protein
MLLIAWWVANPIGFADFANNFGIHINPPAR